MRLSVILSTYNSPDLLEKVLAGYERQTFRDFEVVVADDGSSRSVVDRIAALASSASFPVRHCWHEDHGFRKCEILNRAIELSRAEYLVFSDGDCVPWPNFLEVHADEARPQHFLSGGYFMMSRPLSEALTVDSIREGRIDDGDWLRSHGLEQSWRSRRLFAGPRMSRWLDRLTPTRPSWNGHNASGWKSDLVGVNGFDVRMGYGGEDRELGERLVHRGVTPRQIRHRAICMHLWHERGYVDAEVLRRNREIRDQTAATRASSTPFGIVSAERGGGTAPDRSRE